MQFDFLTPRVERLFADGRWEEVHPGGPAGRLRPPVVLLAREMTAFSLFEAGGVPRARRGQAARLHARTGSPYLVSGSTLSPGGSDFGVWWWDADIVNPMLTTRFGAMARVVKPETLAQPPGVGWRIVRLTEGYEAQFWRDRRLVASAWRRDRYDPASWTAFTRQMRGVDDAPSTPPPAQSLPIDFSAPAFALSPSDLSQEQLMGLGAGAVALAALSLSVFFLGQGAHLASDAEKIEKDTAKIEAATPKAAQINGLEGDKRKLATFAEIEARTNPLTASGAAIGIVALQNLTPTALEAEDDTLTVTLPYSAVASADALIADFEESGYFYDIEPRTDAQNQRLVIEMKVRDAAPPLTAGG